jgi:protein SCO1/2
LNFKPNFPAHIRAIQASAAIAICCLLTACTPRAVELPDYGKVPSFSMTDSHGHAFQSGALDGKVWVADFIYTNCPAECPVMTSRMHSVEKRVQGQENVKLVSISVDPRRDTPPVLDRFANRYGGANDQWIFLTGSPGTVHLLAYTTFHVGDVIGKIEHSTKFVLVDKRGHIRGYYSSFDKEGIPAMLNDVSALRKAS